MNPNQATERSYDQVPYEGYAFAQTHPDRLALVARLFGLSAPPVDRARVLELGCASGENLIPMAYQLPGATFLGTDLSGRQIAAGQKMIDALGLTNIRLEQQDILAMDAGLGQFDYIICHGVYTWVPQIVREKILQIMRTNLSPQGVGHISYNIYPGWHQHAMVREIMRYHAGQFPDAATQITQARAALDFVANGVFDRKSPYAAFLRETAAELRSDGDAYVFHEYLETNNEPLWFHQFWEQITAVGLEYLGDTYLASGMPQDVSPQTQRTLTQLAGDYVRYEQCMDFLRARPFRHSLIVHGGRGVDERRPMIAAMESLLVAAQIEVAQGAQADVAGDAEMVFADIRELRMTTRHPLMKAALWELAHAYPAALPMGELRARVTHRLTGHVSPEMLAQPQPLWLVILEAAWERSVELRTVPPRIATQLTLHPVASAVARAVASFTESVPNQRHQQIKLTPLGKELLLRLDGTRTIEQAGEEIIAAASAGSLRLERDGTPLAGEALTDHVRKQIPKAAAEHLRKSLLVA